MKYNLNSNFKKLINTSGRFVIGGFDSDSGLTGRKIMVDTYGGVSRHGGGFFSGKDSTKVDRSGSYFARYIAKNIVAANLADKCEIQLAYAIGFRKPIAMLIETFGTEKIDIKKIYDTIQKTFDSEIANVIENLQLRKPVYNLTSCFGHFGKNELPWEKLNKVNEIKKT